MSNEEGPSKEERLARAERGECPDCGSTLKDHCEIAFAHGHEIAVIGDVMRRRIAEDMHVDPDVLEMHFVGPGFGSGGFENLLGSGYHQHRTGWPDQSNTGEGSPIQKLFRDLVKTVPAVEAGPVKKVRFAYYLLGGAGIMVLAGFFGTIFYIDRLVKSLVRRGPFSVDE